MIKYADYDYYNNEYNGSLSKDLFDFYIIKSSVIINNNINRRVDEKDITEEFKYVACSLVDKLNEKEEMYNKPTSQSVDGVSITNTVNADKIQSDIFEIISALPHEYTRFL